MAGNSKKPNNDLYDLNDLLTGVTASEETLEDIMAEIYDDTPSAPHTEPEVPLAEEPPFDPLPAPDIPDEAPMTEPMSAAFYAEDREAVADGPLPEEPDFDALFPSDDEIGTEEPLPDAPDFDALCSSDDATETEEALPEAPDFTSILTPDLPSDADEDTEAEPSPDSSDPEDAPTMPPVVWDSDEFQPDVLSDPEKPKLKSKLLLFPGIELPKPAFSSPSAWEDPPDEMPEEVFEDDEDNSRPDGYTPKKVRSRKAPEPEIHEDYRAAAPEEEAVAPNAGRFARWKAKADAFADNMFSQAADTSEDVQMAEKYIPGTDEEDDEAPPEHKPKMPRFLRKPRRPEADLPVQELSRIYSTGMNFMSQRISILAVLTLLNTYLSLAVDGLFPLPLPQFLRTDFRLMAMLQLWLAGWALVFSLDVIWMGLASVKKKLFTLHSLSSLAVLITLLDALFYIFVGRAGPLPYSTPASLLMFCLTWGAYDRKRANQRACRQASVAQDPKRITKDPELWNARNTFTKEQGGTEGFGAQIQAPSSAELLQSRFAPLLLLAALLFAGLVSAAQKKPEQFLWSLSVILIAASPLSAILCFSQPWLRLTRRLERSGAAVAGWPGVDASSGSGGVLITDTDLFPAGSIQFNGIKVFGDISLEKLVGCAASLIRVSGSALSHPFDSLVRTQGGFYRRVDEFRCYEAGGLSGVIRGEQIMVGSASFMAVMDVPLPQDLKVTNAVFCAIDGSLRGIFALNYAKTNSVRPAVQSLLQTHLVPVLVPRDFNVNPSMVRQKLKIPVERMEYPPVERRMELTEPEQEHSPILTALLSRDNVESYAETIVGCRKLRSAVRLNLIATILASLVGLAMGYYLTAMSAFASLSPVNVLLFLGLWLLPTLLISGNVNRY